MRILAALALAAMALAGCGSGDDHPDEEYTCPDGQVLDIESVPGHHDEGFDPASGCRPPVPPSVALDGVPATLEAYTTAPFSWSLDLGDEDHAHSMLTSVHVATEAGVDADLKGPESFGLEIARREHQDLPVTYTSNLNFSTVGTYFVRAYAIVDGIHRWSPASQVSVVPVQATGTEFVLAHSPGGSLGQFGPTGGSLRLGDALVIQNDDLVEHTFTFESAPTAMPDITLAAGAASPPLLLSVPGRYLVATDDVQPLSAEFVV